MAQPLGWVALEDGDALLDLRCPECQSCSRVPATAADLERLDREQTEWRADLVRLYELFVAEAMERLCECMVAALDLDLLTADDFRPRRAPLRTA